MKVDLHNHTHFCNHAKGSMEEYIQKAIQEGIDIFGFSCHNPMRFDEKYRMSFEELPIYLENIEFLKKKYHSQIIIKSALEIDYLPKFLEENIFELPLDYRIGSVHFLGDWGFDNPEFIAEYSKRDINKCWEEYYHAIKHMAKSGLFDIVGHMD
ncbi:MAG: histidinol-phosphatase, partial [Helicobacter sp.]|nr:histidinol-phosphatase [Helicobacter sp.]